MDINLCKITGMSRVDTPNFSTLQEQSDYFDDSIVSTISTTFYPPHFTNEIKMSVEDTNFTSNINYCFFEYGGKRYYYFIDDIEYVNESLINLSITMDTIQTYMFDIRVTNGIIERKFINRYNVVPRPTPHYVINRNYLRENVSAGVFEPNIKAYIHDINEPYIICIKSTEPICKDALDATTKFTLSNGNVVESPFNYSFYFPTQFFKQLVLDNVKFDGTSYSTPTTIYPIESNPLSHIEWEFLNYVLTEPSVIDAYAIPIRYCNQLFTYDSDTQTATLKAPYGQEIMFYKGSNFPSIIQSLQPNHYPFMFTWQIKGSSIGSYTPSICKLDAFYNEESISLTGTNVRNNTIDVPFSSIYMPMLVDENYRYTIFGNNSAQSNYPIHLITGDEAITLYDEFICCNGTSVYNIGRDDSQRRDTYSTVTLDTNIGSFDLFNDPYKDYIANNKNRWASVALESVASGIKSVIDIGTGNYLTGKAIGRIEDNRKRHYRGKLKNKLTPKAQREVDVLRTKQATSNISDITSGALGAIQPVANELIKQSNLKAAPDTPKQIGDYISILTSYQKYMYTQEFRVNDYEQCAWYYHVNGYLVNEYFNSYDVSLFQYVNTRYYFNVLKMKEVEITLDNVVGDASTIDSIKERLIDGLRLWNPDSLEDLPDAPMGCMKYDNVEKSFLS